MIVRNRTQSRRGTLLPMFALALAGLFAFVALAVDIGMIAVAKAEAQASADSGALAGVRTLNGDQANGNKATQAPPNAIAAATSSKILNKTIAPNQVSVQLGSYSYDDATQKFERYIPKKSTDNYTLVKTTVNAGNQAMFARMVGTTSFNTQAVAIAVHRPRDVAVIVDFSGSMRFDTCLGFPYSGTRTKSMNPESVFPRFGHYTDVTTAALQATSHAVLPSGEVMNKSNITVATDSGPAIVEDFYQHSQGSTAQKAFTAVSDGLGYDLIPGGDDYLRVNNGQAGNYAKTVVDVTASSAKHAQFELLGYPQFTGKPFAGYTQGPRYWGKTFFIWPPDPLLTSDWRRKFFFNVDGITQFGIKAGDDNTKLWDSAGNWRVPRDSSGNSYYRINYTAILAWLKDNPNPFPSKLRAGRILYYDNIPSSINLSSFPPTDKNERFWKEYIDHVLGVEQTGGSGNSPVYSNVVKSTGYGDDYVWGTIKISPKPNTTDGRYMDYGDNPRRPRVHFWFGAMSMVDFLGNYNESRFWWPGTCREAPLMPGKIGVRSALQDIEKNHPNDWATLLYFNTPKYSSSDTTGKFNRARVALGRDYKRMIDSLFYPPTTLDNPGLEIRPYDTDMVQVPRASGSTTPAMAFMLAYNQFSSNTTLRTFDTSQAVQGLAGGMGRKGARKLVIFETDGVANAKAYGNLVNNGPYNSYYAVRMASEYPANTGTVDTQLYDIAQKICNLYTDSSAPGYATKRSPVLIHSIAFGALFDPDTPAASARASALAILQQVQYIGKTQADPSTPLPEYKIITGSNEQRIQRMRDVYSKILQDGAQVTLIE